MAALRAALLVLLLACMALACVSADAASPQLEAEGGADGMVLAELVDSVAELAGAGGSDAAFAELGAGAGVAAGGPGEGTRCSSGGRTGVCTTGACNGHRQAGLCPGPAALKCCLPGAPMVRNAPASSSSAGSNAVTTTSIPYKFPYTTGRHIVADVQRQSIRLYDGSKPLREWKMSSGKNGVSFTPNSHGSPVGKFRVAGKYGDGQPLQAILEYMRPTGKLGYPTDAEAHVQTRILQLDGLDAANKNTMSRGIFIHGTNAEMQLGWQGSHGCFRMGNREVVELFNMVKTGTLFFAAPSNAWP